MELQELIERIDRWKARQQGSSTHEVSPAIVMPPAIPTSAYVDEIEEVDSAGDEFAVTSDGIEELEAEEVEESLVEAEHLEDVDAVEDASEIDDASDFSSPEETSEVNLDQIEQIEDALETKDS